MNITNNTSQDYWFGPLHLLPNAVGYVVDDTTETSLYLTDDVVADAINNLAAAGKISVSGAAAPFPRPTGSPDVIHGDGSPEGVQFAPQGSLYLRRDGTGATNLYVKTTGVAISTGWVLVAVPDPWGGVNAGLGLLASTFPAQMANSALVPGSNTSHGCAVQLNAGTVISGLVHNVTVAAAGLTVAYVGVYDASYHLRAVSANATGSYGSAGWAMIALTSPFAVPTSGLYYFADIFAGTTNPTIACISGANAEVSQANPSGQRPFWAGSGSDSTLITPAVPTTSNQAHWVGAY